MNVDSINRIDVLFIESRSSAANKIPISGLQYKWELIVMSGKRRRLVSPFADNLKKLLKENKLNQKSIAKLIGVAPSVVHSWVNGAIPTDYSAVARLCDLYNYDFKWMLTGERTEIDLSNATIEQLFTIENDDKMSGIFLIEAKRLKRR